MAAELLGLAHFYWDTGHLFYLYRKPIDPIFEERDRRLVGEALHPYFGITHKPGYPFEPPEALRPVEGTPKLATNNLGFIAAHDYPYTKTSTRQFVIGIFGGSVGVWFCSVGTPRLLADLSRHPFFQGRELVPLCFSHEGYKQPQQLQVLSYVLSVGQELDLVINIDGFNEVALASINDEKGIDISMPSSQHIEPLVNLANRFTLTPEKLQSLAAIASDRDRMAQLTARIERNRSAAINVALEQIRQRVRGHYAAELVRFDALPSNPSDNSIIQVMPRAGRDRAPEVFASIASNWANASVLMHDLLEPRQVPYVHVLQPNQYSTTRPFAPGEAAVALNPASPFRNGAEMGYPALLAAAPLAYLQSHGVRFLDGTHIFDQEATAVYIDDCCHYTRRGYELLADFLAGNIIRMDGPWGR